MSASATSEVIESGGMDWVAHWHALVEDRRVKIEALARQGPQTGFWDRRATRFAQRVRAADPKSDPLTLAVLNQQQPGDTVLDVGGGPGRYAIPLAANARHVTVVEPAQAMCALLDQSLVESGVGNVRVVPTTWEEATVDPHDLVLCANVLYPIADVVPFIQKLDAHTRRTCAIIMRVDQAPCAVDALWVELWGHPRPPEPGLLDLYNLLFQLGIRANVHLAERTAAGRYVDIEDALQQARNQLFLPADQHEHDDRIRAHLAATLVKDGEGIEAPTAAQYALIWWDKP
jgi:SAM-dependent methyltransferase